VEEVVAVEVDSQGLDLGQRLFRAERVAGGDRAVEQHHRRRGQVVEAVVEQPDLPPVGLLVVACLGVQGRDRRLHLVRPPSSHRDRAVEQAGRLGREPAVPARTVLVLEPDEPAPAVEPGGRARLVQQ
jgi:hypothetical protein